VDPSDPPLDLDEPAFMDLFTEFEPPQDAENMVCEHLLPTTHLINDQGYTCNFHVYIQAATTGILILWMSQVETPDSEETTDAGHLFRANNDGFTLVGLDDDWETIGLQPSPSQRRDRSFLDDDDLGCMDLDLDASSTGFPWHADTGSDVLCHYDLGSAVLDQPVLDLDSDNEEIAEEEAVLDF
jgi:hypothetical protein